MSQALFLPPLSLSSPCSTPDQALTLLSNHTSPRQLAQIHGAVLRANLHQHTIVNFRLQKSYASAARVDKALILFRGTPDPSVYYWTNVIHCHAFHGMHLAALSLFCEMLCSSSASPNSFTLSSTLKACPLSIGKIVHGYSIKQTLNSHPYVSTSLLDMYARAGDINSARYLFTQMPQKLVVSTTAMITCYAKQGDMINARKLFDEMLERERDSVCWNALMDGYVQNGDVSECVELFREMLRSCCKPSEVTVVLVLTAVSQIGCVDLGKWVHSFVRNFRVNGVRLNVRVGNALIDMYCKCGSLDDACKVFDEMLERDVVVYNSMINGFAMHGESKNAMNLFDELVKKGLFPTDITFIGVLNACSHAGLVQEGRKYFEIMEKEYKIEPKIEHFGCMVDMLGRAGFIEEAYEIIKNMKKIKPDSVMWGSLLASCTLHKNMILGEKIANYLVSNNLENSGTYILLSNIYAAAGNWEKVNKIRRLMELNGVQKEVGCSAIEIENKVFEFKAGDKSHPKSEDIYKKLYELNDLIKLHGYVPNLDLVLRDLEESEKERALAVHSERLAVSFGLICTKPGTEIKIVKNLRVCLDCHNAFKLIAKVTKRKIVVRDRNRFHHFSEGKCSCGDFW